MRKPPAACSRTGSVLASSIAASAALVRGIRPPPLPSSSADCSNIQRPGGKTLCPGTGSILSDPGESCCDSLRATLAGGGGMLRRGASGALRLEAGKGAVLRNDSMCNYTDSLPCRCVSMRCCCCWIVALWEEGVWIFLYLYSATLSFFAPIAIHRYLQRDGRARRFPLPVCAGSCEQQAQCIL